MLQYPSMVIMVSVVLIATIGNQWGTFQLHASAVKDSVCNKQGTVLLQCYDNDNSFHNGTLGVNDLFNSLPLPIISLQCVLLLYLILHYTHRLLLWQFDSVS